MPLVPRILAAVTALAVLVMGINCACAGGMNSLMQVRGVDRVGDTVAMPCCAHHGGAAHRCKHWPGANNRRPNPCGGACEHCGQTVINDTVPAPGHTASLLPCAFASIIAIDSVRSPAPDPSLLQSSTPIPENLPPPLTSVTLLSLHCALTD